MTAASCRRGAAPRGLLPLLILLALCFAPSLSQTTELRSLSQPSTPIPPSTSINSTVTTRPVGPEATSVTNPVSARPTATVASDADDLLCRRCLIAMVALAIVAGVFMVTTIVLCSKVLNLCKMSSLQHCRAKMSARSSPTGSSFQGLWIEPAGTMKERSEFWYGGPARRQQNGAVSSAGRTDEDLDLWAQPAAPKARADRGARQNSLSTVGTDRHLLAPPKITLDQISDFWQREGRSDNSSFKAVPSSRDTVSEVGVESNSTEEQGSEFFQGGGPAEGQPGVGDPRSRRQEEEEDEEEIPVVQPRVTPEQISAFWKRGRAPEYTVQRGEVTLL